ncbi:hypothetical protein [Acrocarpospora sp. B8E8]|uniref:hypothetical protein n=1 Tax=Acrocarpospora sp. B8E8 TaxID=3153572 RepID=UPI00325DA7EE
MITSAWSPLDPDIEAFIEDYDRRNAEQGTEATALFAPNFLALDPAHAIALTPAMLAAALPARRDMFAAAGVGAIHRADARQLRLDDQHTLVSIDWTAERADRDPCASNRLSWYAATRAPCASSSTSTTTT